MTKIDLGRTIGILANVGVIAGILLLAVEVQQNNYLLTAQARTTRMEIRKEATNRYLENPGLVQLTLKSRRGESLTDEETYLLEGIMFNLLVTFEHTYVGSQVGLIDEAEVPVVGWRGIFHEQYPAFPDFWPRRKQVFRQEFVDWFEETIVNH